MATPTPMDATPTLGASSDLEIRIARIADPNTDLREKHHVAMEIREMLDTMRDSDSLRGLPYLVPAVVQLLKSSEPSFQKENTEYQLRRALFDILGRLPVTEAVKVHLNLIFSCMLHVLRFDNEENGVTAAKTMVDLIRNYRVVADESITDFLAILQETFANVKVLVGQLLSEDSSVVDPAVLSPAMKSFKVVGEMGMVLVLMSQIPRPTPPAALHSVSAPAFEVLALESPVQHKARTESEAKGGVWSGMAPGIKNPVAYSDFIHAQVKVLSYLAYMMRFSGENDTAYGEKLVLTSLRLLQDCPSNGNAVRKELMVVFRHLMGQNYRRALFGQLDKLFDEQVLLGNGIASKETLRPIVYTAVADLIHHVKNEMTGVQLERVVHVYSSHLHNPATGFNLQTMFAKMMFGLAEAILTKEPAQKASLLLQLMFESCLEKLEGLCAIQAQASASLEKLKETSEDASRFPNDAFFIEKWRPVGSAISTTDKPEDVINECRVVFRTLLHGFRVCLTSLKKCDTPAMDGTLISRFFEGCIRCMALFDPDPRVPDQNEPIDWLGHALAEVNLHVFQEVWTHKMDFFFQAAQKRILLLNICQFIFTRDTTSPTLLAIVLRYLVDRLPSLGEVDDVTAAATIRLYKIAFSAVTTFPATNEAILASHVGKILMDCFPLAAKASKPANYFHLLRALFRAIGVGGGRYELLYNVVLPLLPDMLESLNRQLHASDGPIRDMIVELCLTVPLRLTHLLPHLSYLMQPLALALRGNQDLVSQGLRTLELCIDNLTPDFLDPTLSTVLRELMEALFSHLKPLPAPHHPAHTTIRILGKLGGRNRRLLLKEPALSYRHSSPPATVTISFGGHVEAIVMGPVALYAAANIAKAGPIDRVHMYNYMETCLTVMIFEGIKGRNAEETFVQTLEGVFDALHVPEVQDKAESFIRRLGQAVFSQEFRRHQSREGGRPAPSPLLSCFLDAFPHALARDQPAQIAKMESVVGLIISDLVAMSHQPGVNTGDILGVLHQLIHRFNSLCLDDSWTRKSAGCRAIRLIANSPDFGRRLVSDREVDLVRNLLHILKDLPHDLPRNVEEVVNALIEILKIGNAHLDLQTDAARIKVVQLASVFVTELQSPNALVREAAQKCIQLLEEISGRPAGELLAPHRERMMLGIYTKPLRALPFSKQIGMIEAIRYCVGLEPPLVELNDELLRLLHETLALADADDTQLMAPRNTRSAAGVEIVKLRVACIKLLTASMALTDFFSRQPATRQKVTSVYFKSLYSPAPEVKDVAHEGLRNVLTHQTRLPKELLQTGLRPILMNLADPKRLSIPGLEGLARLLELLTNYFKVEIGSKLLDHFRIVADPQLLQESSKVSLSDNEGIVKLVRLANIFHLLPSTANMFLDPLVNCIVQTEAQMHFSSKSPFSEPLAKYLDRYPAEGIDFLVKHLSYSRHMRTFRSILQANLAPNLLRELSSRTLSLVNILQTTTERNTVLSLLNIFDDLSTLLPTWLSDNGFVIDALVNIWQSKAGTGTSSIEETIETVHKCDVILSIFHKALSQSPRIDILFEITLVYSLNLPMDTFATTRFLHNLVTEERDNVYRRNVLMRFLTWFSDERYSWIQKASFIRYVIVPILVTQATKSSNESIIDPAFIDQLHRLLWIPAVESTTFAEVEDVVKIEFIYLTTLLVQYYPSLIDGVRKDIMKYAWLHINGNEDVVIKQTAYLLGARFFAAFPTPQKFILRAWTGLLRIPHGDGRTALRQEALAVMAPSLPKSEPEQASHPPQWAKTTRRLLAEEGFGPMVTVYHLMVKQPDLFFPVRSLFMSHIANSLTKLGLPASSTMEQRHLSIDLLQVVFNWEEQAAQVAKRVASGAEQVTDDSAWLTPLPLRENMVSYLVRLTTTVADQNLRAAILPKALPLLQLIVGPNGWTDVIFGLRFFSRVLESEIVPDNATSFAQAIAAAKVLHVIAAEQPDSWYTANAPILQRLIRKGLKVEDTSLQESLLPIFDHLVKLYPKEEDEQSQEMRDFHSWIHQTIDEGLKNSTSLAGVLGMLKSVVSVAPERIENYSQLLMKLLSKFTKEHIHLTAGTHGYDSNVRSITTILTICQQSVTFLGDQRRWLLSTLLVIVDKSKSVALCRYILDLARSWALQKSEAYPTMKEKATLLQKMTLFENRGEAIFHPYLELIYDIYTEPALRRSDLTNRLEQSFLLGCRAKDPALRERFIDLLDVSVPRSMFGRLTYVLGVQSWDALADHHWIYLALHLLLGSSDVEIRLNPAHRQFGQDNPSIGKPTTQSVIRPMQRLLFLDPQAAHDTWVSLFPAIWTSLSRREQSEITTHMVVLLSKDYHSKQAFLRPNVIQTLLTGIHACNPPMVLPPHLVKYLAKSFGAWHIALEILERSLESTRDDEVAAVDYIHDSLADVYAELAEEDMFYGLWRRRAIRNETNIGLAYEQAGMWEQAAHAYEGAQGRVRAGTIPFSETEFCLWEDHWILAAEKLQHWDVLYEFAKSEGNQELMLECAWRTKNWGEQKEALEDQVNQLPEVPTPRRRVFEAFIALLKNPSTPDKNSDFTRFLEDAMQLSLRKWVGLPQNLSSAHVPLLQHFQQFVELQEATQIFVSLSQTTAANLEKKSSELKMVLQAWRERLPNIYDDINIWSDLIHWRQHVFSAINDAYQPLIPNPTPQAPNNNTYGYRGFHEQAWIINRFAHVARKHGLLDVCFNSLNKIYTLPNIEISEAFLKLREQAKAHYQKPSDLPSGLEVINNTNLMFFSTAQKAEFYTLKGMFYARLNRPEDATVSFGQAVQLDMSQAKAWAEWGKYSDRAFKDSPNDLSLAANAVSCYLQAAGLYKSGKSRSLLTRILWLLSIDDATSTVSRAFDTYKGEAAFWYWITLIPQLCFSLNHRETKQARYLLLNLARHYPQAIFYYLRTIREEQQLMKKAILARAQAEAANRRSNGESKDGESGPDGSTAGTGDTPNAQATPTIIPGLDAVRTEQLDEVLQTLKTTFPLLILSLETMVDQIQHKFKPAPEEDVYRTICALLTDAIQTYVVKINSEDDGVLMPNTYANLARMLLSMPPHYKKDFEDDFINAKTTYYDYILKLEHWRDRFEAIIDSRPRLQPLANLSHYLAEFQYSKVDEIEVPGQYTEDKDSNQNFVRIQKFSPKFENYRQSGYYWKRITLHGHDYSKTSFLVQIPCSRQHRREDRVYQMLRTFSGALARNKETRKRNLAFHVPAAVLCSPNVRLHQVDASYVSFIDIYDQHCQKMGFSREEPILAAGEKLRPVLRDYRESTKKQQPSKNEYFTLKREIMDEVCAKMVPDDVLTKYMSRTMDGPTELWRMRKQFALQVASTSFATYTFFLTGRQPQRFLLSRATGLMTMTDMIPSLQTMQPVYANTDLVPFRLTPNMQKFLGPIFTEGILVPGLMAMGRALTEPEFELEQQLCLLSRDEVSSWFNMKGRNQPVDASFRNLVQIHSGEVIKRVEVLACKLEREQANINNGASLTVPVVQTVTSLVSTATNAVNLAKMGELFLPWF